MLNDETITEREFDRYVDKASKIVAKVYSKKRRLDSQGVPLIFKILLSVAFLFSVIFLAMGYFVPQMGLAY